MCSENELQTSKWKNIYKIDNAFYSGGTNWLKVLNDAHQV